MKSEIALEILQTSKLMRRKMAKMVEVKSFSGNLDSVPELFELIDYIDKKLSSYRKKYLRYKRKETGKEEEGDAKDANDEKNKDGEGENEGNEENEGKEENKDEEVK
jgi:uncharacterized membrane protein YukC